MKCTRIMFFSVLLLGSMLLLQSCTTESKASETESATVSLNNNNTQITASANEKPTKTSQVLKWYTIDEIEKLQSEKPKKVIVDVYTSWCRWCKVMDQKTFTDETLIKYLNENYYMVKFNAELKTDIMFKGEKYAYRSNGLKGYNSLAVELTQGKLSYPSFVVLDEKLSTLHVTRGYKTATQFKEALDGINPI